jgi:pathogenesis-related protein 1
VYAWAMRYSVAALLVLAGCSSASSSGAPGASTGADAATPADESQWLTGMNAARAAVGEPPLTWDPVAAQVAQTYAAGCDFVHNPNRDSQYQTAGGGTGGLGENIAAGAPTQEPADAVTAWVAEQQDYDHAGNSCASGQVCGHYTQIVWSATTRVGCGHFSCTTNSPFGSSFADWDYNVCDFSPPGNVVGQPPY